MLKTTRKNVQEKTPEDHNQEREWYPPENIWNMMFLSIFFANMSMNLGMQMSNSLLALYAKSLSAPANQIGQLMSMFAVTALIFRFISGPAMNAYNRKLILIAAMGLFSFSYFGFSLSPIIAAKTGIPVITVLKLFRLLQGIGNAFGNSCCLAIVSDVLPVNQFTSGMGYYACAQIVSQAIGPTVGVYLKNIFGYNSVYVIFGFVMISAMLFASQIKLAPNATVPFNLKIHNMIAMECLIPTTINFLIAIGYTSINSFLLVYAEERNISGASLFFTIYALTMLITRPLVGKLTDRYGFVKIAIPACLMTVLSLIMIGISGSLATLLLSAFLNAFGYGSIQPMLQSLCMKAVPPEKRGSASSTNYLGLDLATLVGPTVCGIAANLLGYSPIMWIAMTLPVFVGILFIFFCRNKIGNIEKNFNSKTSS